MYKRQLLASAPGKSFFLFGPRGTGKTSWLLHSFPDACYFDCLDSALHTSLQASPARLANLIPADFSGRVIIDEIQRIPELLNEVHRLIERRRLSFILTGSSARKLRRSGVNLLAGRALTCHMHPLTAAEAGADFKLTQALQYGMLPAIFSEAAPKAFLQSYVATYLREEVQQEALVRNMAGFTRLLEAASFSQAQVLNMAGIARECGVNAKVAEGYFTILEDLLIALRVPVFTRRAKRKLIAHPKFFFFDAGVFTAIRPRGPLDSSEEIQGAALETLFLQQLRALNDNLDLGYSIHYWRTASKHEVDFVLYGEKGLLAFEIKHSSRATREDTAGLRLFLEDYPKARCCLLYTGDREWHESGIEIMKYENALKGLANLLS